MRRRRIKLRGITRSRAVGTTTAVVLAASLFPVLVPAAASAAPSETRAATAFPAPGDAHAAAGADITVRGVDPAGVASVTVTGSVSGEHPGVLTRLSAAEGVTFNPAEDFVPGEQVSVRAAGISFADTGSSEYTFTVARPGAAIDPAALVAGTDVAAAAAAPTPCQAAPRQYVTQPDLGVVPGACASGPDVDASGDKIFTSMAPGPGIYDRTGELVWHAKAGGNIFGTVKPVTYRGENLLAYYSGNSSAVPGSGQGEYVLVDQSYKRVHTVRAADGYQADLHEVEITPQGTALVGIYASVWTPLGDIIDFVVQEVEVDTGKKLFEWHALDHVDIADSYFPRALFLPWDYIHGNSVQQTADGNLLVSARHTWASYKISRSTGDLIWTHGGKRSSFGPMTAGPGVAASEAHEYCWQHDVQEVAPNTYTVLDNASALGIPQRCGNGETRGLQFTLTDPVAGAPGTSVITDVYRPSPGAAAGFAANMQTLPDGSRLLGLGGVPRATLLDADGTPTLEMGFTEAGYRAYSAPWKGAPTGGPSAVVSADRSTVHVSWNGATEVRSYQVLAGADATSLEPVGARQPRTGFETALTLPASAGPVVRVQALDERGTVLGTSGTPVSGSTTLAALQATAPVGTGTLSTSPSGDSLQLPPVTADFSLLFGLVPARTTLSLRPTSNAQGTAIPVQASYSETGSTLSFQARLHLEDLSFFGFSVQPLIGSTCETTAPVTVTLTSSGDARLGSELTGSYAIPSFAGCGLADGLVSSISVPDNTLRLTLS
ncbi:arylsulfotransferase family protein [Rhodococcus sp. X156]|uniref:arylsulfotransferase family protein n=1 Tax=Rhodococcus sp. X156 TaxID=2499145 RepID=UPI000FDC6812|nr:arylsulfotransferase family protein [Rhodococcus sp. X156]